jgi:hypothetical protein
VPLTAPSGSSLFIQANPTSIPANGGVSVITVTVLEQAGTPPPNGTVVFFFTNLGHIDSEARTKDGVVRVNLVSDSRSGKATVNAVSGGTATAPSAAPSSSPSATPTPTLGRLSFGLAEANAAGENSAKIEVMIGNILPVRMIMTADPQRITSPRSSRITANVFDGDGNPVANVPVIFSLGDISVSPTTTTTTLSTTTTTTTPLTAAQTGALEESLDSGGTPQFTDTNGQAFDTLRTRAPLIPAKTVKVSAITPNGTNSSVTVSIN